MDDVVYAPAIQAEIEENMVLVQQVVGHPHHIVEEALAHSNDGADAAAANTWVHKLVTEHINTPLSGKLACKDKCSHCCYQAVSINSWEARRINSFLKKTTVVVDFVPDADYVQEADDLGISAFLASREKFIGKACPFLDAESRCTIYPVRPLECRLLYNISNTSSLCTDPVGHTPAVNFGELHNFVLAVNWGKETFADIRDFFPTVKMIKEQ